MNNDFKVNLESLLYSYYIKYDRLLEMNKYINGDEKTQYIDIYVDLYDMLKKVYSTDIYATKKFIIVSSIINLAAHMRAYYITRHRIWARIFIVYGDCSTINHKQFYPGFGVDQHKNALNYEKTTEFINSQLELVKILCAYINDVYFIRKSTDFTMFVYDSIAKNPKNISIIITKSKYAYQIPALCENAYIFRPRKTSDGDVSQIISHNNTLFGFFNKIQSQVVLDRLRIINPELLSVIMSLNGLKDKNVASLTNITRTTMLIEDAIRNNRIINGYNSDIGYLYANLIGINHIVDPASFDFRFKAIDLVYQHRLYNSQIEARDMSWFLNLNDVKTVQDINNKYFVDNPLDLNNL